MSSLRSIIQKGRFYIPDYLGQECAHAFMTYMVSGLRDPKTKLINAQSVWNDTVMPPVERRDGDSWDRLLNFQAIPRPKPPFEKVWLEALIPAEHGVREQRIGSLVLRIEGTENILRNFNSTGMMPEDAINQIAIDRPTTFVNTILSHDYNGSACVTGNCIYWLNQDGQFMWSFRMATLALDEQDEKSKRECYVQMRMRQGWMLHTFARLNCANATLIPIPDGKPSHRRHDRAPSSVWHEIRVSAAPKVRHATPSLSASDDGRHLRFHWVRGHYADYTKGKGLFGNPKLRQLFWIPEHQAGDEEAGTVMASYTVN